MILIWHNNDMFVLFINNAMRLEALGGKREREIW